MEYDLHVFKPSPVDILLYVQLLVNSRKTVRTIKNYLSGAKLFVIERGGEASAFSHHMLSNFVKGVTRDSTHVPRQAIAIPTQTLTRACSFLMSSSDQGEIIAAAMLFAFTTMLRQCHMFYTPYGYMHIIKRGDVEFKGSKVLITVRSSKTTGRSHVTTIPIIASPSGPNCPVRALVRAFNIVPAGSHEPVFLDPVLRRPFPAAHANLILRSALSAVGFRGAVLASFHSLRRSSAQACIKAGLPLQDVQTHAMWRSAAVSSYVPREMINTAQVLTTRLANNE